MCGEHTVHQNSTTEKLRSSEKVGESRKIGIKMNKNKHLRKNWYKDRASKNLKKL